MFRKLRKHVQRVEWLTPPVMMAMVVTNAFALQNHFVHAPFSKLMQQHGLVDAISGLNSLLAGISIVAALITMSIRGSWVKWVATIACLGSTSLILCYPWALSQPEPTALYIVRCNHILLESILSGSVASVLRMVASEEPGPHKKTMALDGTIWAIITFFAKFLGFWLIEDPQTWAICATAINLIIIAFIWRVNLDRQETNNKEKKRRNAYDTQKKWNVIKAESKQWALALGRQVPTIGNNVVFVLTAGGAYLPLFIDDKWLASASLGVSSLATMIGSWLSANIPKTWDERIVIAGASIISIGVLQYFYWVDAKNIYTILCSGLIGITYGMTHNSYGYLMNRCTDPNRKGIAVGSGRASFAGSSLFCALLLGWIGVNRDFWLWGSICVVVTLAILPLVKYPPFNDTKEDVGEANSL